MNYLDYLDHEWNQRNFGWEGKEWGWGWNREEGGEECLRHGTRC